MAYVSTTIKIGDRVRLDEQVNLNNGYFERGTIMKVVGQSYLGYDLEDENGEKLYEYGVVPSPAKLTKI
jgi:hypothetical protein